MVRFTKAVLFPLKYYTTYGTWTNIDLNNPVSANYIASYVPMNSKAIKRDGHFNIYIGGITLNIKQNLIEMYCGQRVHYGYNYLLEDHDLIQW